MLQAKAAIEMQREQSKLYVETGKAEMAVKHQETMNKLKEVEVKLKNKTVKNKVMEDTESEDED